MKIAVLHEMLVKLGGAEKVVKKILEIFPDADLYTLMYDEKKVGEVFPRKYGKGKEIKTPKVTQGLYELFKNQRLCLPFMAKAVESLDFSKYDILIISSSGFAHGAITKPETKTIVYYHSPARYLWDWTNEYKKDIGWNTGWKAWLIGKIFLKLREWDYIASQRGAITLANSKNVAQRIQKYYRKESQVVYPPVEVGRFQTEIPEEAFTIVSHKFGLKSKDYYIVLGALTEFKKVHIPLHSFQTMPEKNLVIIGEGNLKNRFEGMIGSNKNIKIIGAQYGADLVALVQNAKGLIFPGEEDFGIVPIEAMGAGIPVFAYKAGGLLESVIEGKTGEFFENDEGKDFTRLFQLFDKKIDAGFFKKEDIQKHANIFDEALFESTLNKCIEL